MTEFNSKSESPEILPPIEEQTGGAKKILINTLMIIGVMFVFLVSLKMMGGSFKLFGKDFAHALITTTSNPFVGLFIGLLATAVIQSSSTTTSMIVVMVAAGDLNLASAVPMIMGANIGTSVTSTFVSMAHMREKMEFRKAISAATVHDFFNIMVVLILFPLEISFGFLSNFAEFLAGYMADSEKGPEMFSILKYTVKPVAKFLIGITGKNGFISLFMALVLLAGSLHFLTKILKKLLIGKAQQRMDSIIFNKPAKAMFWGTVLTAGVQSSSVTTSLVVPLVATNKVSLRKAFPFLMGANIGTTVTALIAALSADNKYAALSVALAHVLFNVLGAAIIFPIKVLRDIPIKLARKLGKATLKNKLVGFAYVAVTFFIIPMLLISVSGSQKSLVITEYNYKVTELNTNKSSFTIIVQEDRSGELTRKQYIDLDSLNTDIVKLKSLKTKVKRVEENGNIAYFGDDFFIFQKKEYCWDSEDLNGKFNVCVDHIKENYKVKDDYNAEKCYVFRKQFYSGDSLSPAKSLIYINEKDLLILKSEEYDANGRLIRKQELM